MKNKGLIVATGVAFVGVMSVPALASSSVTLYGAVDAGIGLVTKKLDPVHGGRVRMMTSSWMNTGHSFIGFRGEEDLGHGLHAGFIFETSLSLADGSMKTYTHAGFWGRRANMWLRGNWGKLTVGRTYTPTDWGQYVWSLTGQTIYSAASNTYEYLQTGDAAWTSRTNSQIRYSTPNLNGWSSMVGFLTPQDGRDFGYKGAVVDFNVMYEDDKFGAAIYGNKSKGVTAGYGLGARYVMGDFTISGAYDNNHNLRRGLIASGQYRMGPLSFTVELVRDLKNRRGSKRYTNATLESRYRLSKSTFAYAAFMRLDGGNGYGIGLRKGF